MRSGEVFLNDGRAVFEEATALLAPPSLINAADVVLDFDGDGDLDLFGLRHPGGSEAFRNDGTGRFTSVPGPAMPGSAFGTRPVIEDFDRDGDLDLFYPSIIVPYLLRNDGGLQFTDVYPASMPVHADPRSAVGGDFDADGDIDLVVLPGTLGSRLLMLQNDGSGSFSDVPAGVLGSLGGSRLIAIDVEGDGDLDVIANGRILLNDGLGMFSLGATTIDDTYLAAVDIDDDADQDLLTRDEIWLNDGTGHFTRLASAAIDGDVGATANQPIGDLDGDGDLDRFLAGDRGHSRLMFNEGGATFRIDGGAPIVAEAGDGLGWFIDADGDGAADVARIELTSFRRVANNELHVGDAVGGYEDVTALHGVNGTASGVLSTIDLDADGDSDLLAGDLSIWRNDGNGQFARVTGLVMPLALVATVSQVRVFDIDGDGDDDIYAFSFDSTSRPLVLLQQPDGRFVEDGVARVPALGLRHGTIRVFDADTDGDVDLLVLSNLITSNQVMRLLINDGTGVFVDEAAARLPTISRPWRVVDMDFDNDGDRDILWGRRDTALNAQGWAFENDGTGHFSIRSGVWPGATRLARVLAVVDLDGDGDEDLMKGTTNGAVQVYVQEAGLLVESTAVRFATDESHDVTNFDFADVDLDGDLDVYVSTDDGDGDRIYINRHRQLTSPGFAAIGHPLTMSLHSTPGYGVSDVMGVLLLNFQAAAAPIATPFGNFLIEPVGHVLARSGVIPASTGCVEFTLSVPQDPALVGLSTHWQGAIIDASGAVPQIWLTNRQVETIGD